MEPFWGDGSTGINNAPPDVPLCDFDGSACGIVIINYNTTQPEMDTWVKIPSVSGDSTASIVTGSVVAFLLFLVLVAGFIVRYESELNVLVVWEVVDSFVLTTFAHFRRVWKERQLSSMTWRIFYDEIKPYEGQGAMPGSSVRKTQPTNTLNKQISLCISRARGSR